MYAKAGMLSARELARLVEERSELAKQKEDEEPAEGCEQNTLTRHIFSRFTHTHFNVARDIGSRCLVRITSCHHAFGCCV